MSRHFRDDLPHVFQLQTGNTGNPNATDWTDVGTPITNGYFGIDDERREGNFGKRLLTHYRVKLTTPTKVYVSQPVSTYGELGEKDTTCVDPLTGEILDSKCPDCNGVGFQVGYHAPTPLVLDMSPEAVVELRKATEPPGPSRKVELKGRCLGFPQLNKEDVWVDAKSDQRWFIHEIMHLSEWRGVPLIVHAGIKLAPYTSQVYKIEVGGEDAELPGPTLPGTGPGTVHVDHDYCSPDEESDARPRCC
jgi:hypothetical protein